MSGTYDSLTAGPLIIGGSLSVFLAGISVNQTYLYFYNFPKDPRYLKFTVAFLCFGEAFHLSTVVALLYDVFVTNFNNAHIFATVPATLATYVFTSAIVGATSQIIYLHRVKILTRAPLLYLPCFVLYLAKYIVTVALGVIAYSRQPIQVMLTNWAWLFQLSMALDIANDMLLSVSLSYFFWMKRRLSFDDSRTVLNRLILWSIETGILTTTFSVALIIVFIKLRSTWVWIALMIVGPRLYTLSLLASLNMRKHFQERYRTAQTVWDVGPEADLLPGVNAEGTRRSTISIGMTVGVEQITDSLESISIPPEPKVMS